MSVERLNGSMVSWFPPKKGVLHFCPVTRPLVPLPAALDFISSISFHLAARSSLLYQQVSVCRFHRPLSSSFPSRLYSKWIMLLGIKLPAMKISSIVLTSGCLFTCRLWLCRCLCRCLWLDQLRHKQASQAMAALNKRKASMANNHHYP
jgi:hypothetical protein